MLWLLLLAMGQVDGPPPHRQVQPPRRFFTPDQLNAALVGAGGASAPMSIPFANDIAKLAANNPEALKKVVEWAAQNRELLDLGQDVPPAMKAMAENLVKNPEFQKLLKDEDFRRQIADLAKKWSNERSRRDRNGIVEPDGSDGPRRQGNLPPIGPASKPRPPGASDFREPEGGEPRDRGDPAHETAPIGDPRRQRGSRPSAIDEPKASSPPPAHARGGDGDESDRDALKRATQALREIGGPNLDPQNLRDAWQKMVHGSSGTRPQSRSSLTPAEPTTQAPSWTERIGVGAWSGPVFNHAGRAANWAASAGQGIGNRVAGWTRNIQVRPPSATLAFSSSDLTRISLPSINPADAGWTLMWMFVVIGGAALTAWWLRNAGPWPSADGRRRRIVALAAATPRARVVQLFEQLALDRFGDQALPRHHRQLADQFANGVAHDTPAARFADLYETARYAPPSVALSDGAVDDATTLAVALRHPAK